MRLEGSRPTKPMSTATLGKLSPSLVLVPHLWAAIAVGFWYTLTRGSLENKQRKRMSRYKLEIDKIPLTVLFEMFAST